MQKKKLLAAETAQGKKDGSVRAKLLDLKKNMGGLPHPAEKKSAKQFEARQREAKTWIQTETKLVEGEVLAAGPSLLRSITERTNEFDWVTAKCTTDCQAVLDRILSKLLVDAHGEEKIAPLRDFVDGAWKEELQALEDKVTD